MRSVSAKHFVMIALVSVLVSSSVSYMSLSLAQLSGEDEGGEDGSYDGDTGYSDDLGTDGGADYGTGGDTGYSDDSGYDAGGDIGYSDDSGYGFDSGGDTGVGDDSGFSGGDTGTGDIGSGQTGDGTTGGATDGGTTGGTTGGGQESRNYCLTGGVAAPSLACRTCLLKECKADIPVSESWAKCFDECRGNKQSGDSQQEEYRKYMEEYQKYQEEMRKRSEDEARRGAPTYTCFSPAGGYIQTQNPADCDPDQTKYYRQSTGGDNRGGFPGYDPWNQSGFPGMDPAAQGYPMYPEYEDDVPMWNEGRPSAPYEPVSTEFEQRIFGSYFQAENLDEETFRTVPVIIATPAVVFDVIGRGMQILGEALQEMSLNARAAAIIQQAMFSLQTPGLDPLKVESIIREAMSALSDAAQHAAAPVEVVEEIDYQEILKTIAILLEQTIPQIESIFEQNGLPVPAEAKDASAAARAAVIAALAPCRANEVGCGPAIDDALSAMEAYRSIMEQALASSQRAEQIRVEIEAIMPAAEVEYEDEVMVP
ncbi:hypothetical protein HYZ99_02760 [Candidatus Peregrinibacteria bacterium]|nr:hypothetical protein [Candidatus Peregrinibacteria bacterium]